MLGLLDVGHQPAPWRWQARRASANGVEASERLKSTARDARPWRYARPADTLSDREPRGIWGDPAGR